MRAEGFSARRHLVFVLVAVGHTCLILLLTHRQLLESNIETVGDASMTLILFPPKDPRPPDQVQPVRRTAAHPVPALQFVPAAVTAAPPTQVNSGNAVDWEAEKLRVAGSMAQPPQIRTFGAHPRTELDGPQAREPAHHAGETYRDIYGDTIVWISERCFLTSEAPQLGTPEVFKHSRPTRLGCKPQGPATGELFKDLPEYQQRHSE